MTHIKGKIGYFGCFAILFFLGLWANALRHGWATPVVGEQHLTLAGTADQVISDYGLADPATYAKGAQTMLAGLAPNYPYLKYWPPGLMVLEALLLQLVPAHFILGLFIVTAAAWSAAMGYLALVLRAVSGSRWFPALLFGVFAFPLFRLYFFGAGIVFSESLSIALFIPGMLMMVRSLQTGSCWLGLSAGLVTAASALTRAQLLLAMLVLMGLGLLALLFYAAFCIKRRLRPGREPRSIILAGAVFAGAYTLCVYGYAMWNDGSVVHMEYTYARVWDARPAEPNWEDRGGIGVLCQADPATCTRLRSQPEVTWQEGRVAAIHALTHHFLTVATLKTGYFIRYFMAKTTWFPADFQAYDFRENIPLALLDMLGLIGSTLLARQFLFAILAAIQVAVWTGTLSASFLLIHIEVRYFYIAKTMSLVVALLVLAELWRRWRLRDVRIIPVSR